MRWTTIVAHSTVQYATMVKELITGDLPVLLACNNKWPTDNDAPADKINKCNKYNFSFSHNHLLLQLNDDMEISGISCRLADFMETQLGLRIPETTSSD